MKPMSKAEALLDLVADLGTPRDEIINAGDGNREWTDRDFAVIALARRFGELPVGVRFRAMAEGWNQQRIVREVW